MIKVYCKPTEKGVHSFFLSVEGKDYFLFRQRYSTSNRNFFGSGVPLDRVFSFRNVHSVATQRTLDKIQTAIPLAERRFGIAVTKKQLRKTDRRFERSAPRYLEAI